MNSKIFSAIEHIKSVASAKNYLGDAAMAFNTINKYFGNLIEARNLGKPRLSYLSGFMNFWSLTESKGLYYSQFFLFATHWLKITNKFKPIYENVALPYRNWVANKWGAFAPVVKNVKRGDEYVFVCRHAVTTGAYAPGSSIYTFANALLDAKKK